MKVNRTPLPRSRDEFPSTGRSRGKGVWGDMEMGYSKGEFSPTEWAFADFRDGRYNGSLMTIREKMKAGMRK